MAGLAPAQERDLVVIVFCLMVAMVIWVMDIASRFLINFIMGMFGA
jgi:hypothetical protein